MASVGPTPIKYQEAAAMALARCVNTTVHQGESASLVWIFDGTLDGSTVFDRFAKTISVFFTPPGDTEKSVFSVSVGPNDDPLSDFCGFWPGYWIAGAIPSDDVGTYNARWSVEFGQSTQPDAPVNPNPGCGPLPFDSKTVELERSWEVVAAE